MEFVGNRPTVTYSTSVSVSVCNVDHHAEGIVYCIKTWATVLRWQPFSALWKADENCRAVAARSKYNIKIQSQRSGRKLVSQNRRFQSKRPNLDHLIIGCQSDCEPGVGCLQRMASLQGGALSQVAQAGLVNANSSLIFDRFLLILERQERWFSILSKLGTLGRNSGQE
jgi:hypothetical protein